MLSLLFASILNRDHCKNRFVYATHYAQFFQNLLLFSEEDRRPISALREKQCFSLEQSTRYNPSIDQKHYPMGFLTVFPLWKTIFSMEESQKCLLFVSK